MKKHLVAAALGALLASGTLQAAPPLEQTPFTQSELDRFVADYPGFTQWLGKHHTLSGEARHTPWMMSGMRFDPAFPALLKEKGWNPERFFYVLNHVNTGLMLATTEKNQAEAQARLAKEQKEQEARAAQEQQKMRQEISAANEKMREQLKAQKEQIRTNPYIPPHEKQRILDQMDRGASGMLQGDAQSAGSSAQAQQANWMASQEQAIRANPYLNPWQRQQALAQLQQARASMQRAPTAVQPPKDVEAAQAEMRNMQNKWFENQKQVLMNAPTLPPAQKKAQLEQLQNAEKQFLASRNQPGPTPLIPKEESALIQAQQPRLAELLAIQ